MTEYDLGVLIPVYNAEQSIRQSAGEISSILDGAGLSWRLILIDDGSTDGSAGLLHSLAKEDSRITAAGLSRNFGQQNALFCGLRLARDCRAVATLDDDLQHPPELLPDLYKKLSEGYELAYGIPERGEDSRPPLRRWGSRLRDLLFSSVIRPPRGIRVSAYRVMSGELARRIAGEKRSFVYLSASAFRYGPRTANLPYSPRPRLHGRSGYTGGRLIRLFLKLFAHYALPGFAVLRQNRPPYALAWVMTGGKLFEHTDDLRRFQLPDQRPEGGEGERPPDRAGGLF